MTKEEKLKVARSLKASAERWYWAAAFVFGVAIASAVRAFSAVDLGSWAWGFGSAALFAMSVGIYFGGGGRSDVASHIDKEASDDLE